MSSTQAQSFLLLLLTIILSYSIKLTESKSINLPSPQCHPSVVDSMPPRIRKICEALETIWEFSDAMDTYLEEKGNNLLWSDSFFFFFFF